MHRGWRLIVGIVPLTWTAQGYFYQICASTRSFIYRPLHMERERKRRYDRDCVACALQFYFEQASVSQQLGVSAERQSENTITLLAALSTHHYVVVLIRQTLARPILYPHPSHYHPITPRKHNAFSSQVDPQHFWTFKILFFYFQTFFYIYQPNSANRRCNGTQVSPLSFHSTAPNPSRTLLPFATPPQTI